MNEIELKQEVVPVVQRAGEIAVASPADYTCAAEFLKAIKATQKKVTDFFAPLKTKAHEAHKAITTAEAANMKPLTDAEATIKRKMLTYSMEHERIRQEEERRLQAVKDEEKRKEREAAEAAAKIQREKEQEARRQIEEAQRKADASKNAEDAERLKLKIEQAQKEARAAAAKAALQEEAANEAVSTKINLASTTPDVKGQSIKRIWKARITDVAKLDRKWMIIDDKAIQAFARATSGTVPQDGIEFYEDAILSSRSK